MITKTKTLEPTDWRTTVVTALATLPERADLPGVLSDTEKDTHAERRRQMLLLVNVWPMATGELDGAQAKRAVLVDARDRLLGVKATITTRLDAAPDYRQIADERARDAQWISTTGLRASLTTLERGAEYFAGVPALPAPLRALLTPEPCETCKRPHETFWPGPSLPDLDRLIAEQDDLIARASAQIDRHVADARALLAERETTPV